jgi:hypothetical protein
MGNNIKTKLTKGSASISGFSVAFNRNLFGRLRKVPFKTAFILLLFLFSLAAPVYGFVKLPSKERMTVRVVGTKNFGEQVVFDKEVEVRVGATAGEALEQAVEIGMSGSFIETIEGIKGNQTEYWLYYINGVMANVFAHGYKLHPGDVQYWDFHDWTFYMHGPSAALGAFPEPCRQGYGGKVAPILVAYAEGFQNDAQKLKEKLVALGVRKVVVKDTGALTAEEKGKSNLFIIAPAGHNLLDELNKQYREQGTIYFADEKIIVRNHKGKPAATYGPGWGVLQVTQNPWNPKGSWACEGTVWIVSGADDAGVKRAAYVLINQPEKLKYTFAAVIGENQLIKAPVTASGIKTVSVKTGEDVLAAAGPAGGEKQVPAEKQQAGAGTDGSRATGEEKASREQPAAGRADEQKQAESEAQEQQATSAETAGEEGKANGESLTEQPWADQEKAVGNKAAPAGRVADFWWIIPLAAALGATVWWLKRKRN